MSFITISATASAPKEITSVGDLQLRVQDTACRLGADKVYCMHQRSLGFVIGPTSFVQWWNFPNVGVIHAYQNALDIALLSLHPDWRDEVDAVAFIHDDVQIHEPARERIVRAFQDPQVGVVGFGGATGLGVDDIYKTPYRLEQLIRVDYYSNQTDWRTHGEREIGEREVAVVDGFFMAIRLDLLRKIGGWKLFPFGFHMYDAFMCLMARRHGYKVMMVGVECTHYGGGTSTKEEYKAMLRRQGRTLEQDHQEPHKWIYEEFRDLLPVRVKQGK